MTADKPKSDNSLFADLFVFVSAGFDYFSIPSVSYGLCK